MAVFYTKWSFSGTDVPNSIYYLVDGPMGGERKYYYNDVRYKFVVSEKVNELTNKSTMTVKKYAVFYYTWEDTGNVDLIITMKSRMPSNGTYQSDYNVLVPTDDPNDYVLVGTDTFVINHNADGTGTASFMGLGTYTGGSGTVYTRTVTKSDITLTDINRGSTITSNATSSTKFGDTITFTITKKVDNPDYVHDLTYSIYDGTGAIVTGLTALTKDWTIPTSLVNYSPNNSEPIITIKIVTRNGTTIIDSNIYSFKCLVPNNYKPTCQLVLTEDGIVPANWGIYVQTKSNIKGTISTDVSVEGDTATIKSYLTESFLNNSDVNKYRTNPFITIPVAEAGNYTLKTKVVDSRGRESDYDNNNTKLIEIVEYRVPTIDSIATIRCNADGTANEEGTYAKLRINYSISSCQNKNDKSMVVTQGSQSKTISLIEYEGSVTTPVFENMSPSQSYVFNVLLIDTFSDDNSQTITLQPSFVTRSYLAGGKGITFGRDATEPGFHDYLGSNFHNGAIVNKLNIDGFKVEKYGDIYIAYVE